MGTYSNKSPLIPEANAEAYLSHLAQFYPGSYFPVSKPSLNPSREVEVDPEPGLTVTPICSVTPIKDSMNDMNKGIKTKKSRKQKSSTKGPNHITPKISRPKQSKKKASSEKRKAPILPETRREKKNLNIDTDIANFDFSGTPSPVCSCTGVARVCYKWGAGGWQSSCCTINISEYPLPMSSTRPGARLAGRKMSNGAYMKLLLRLAVEGYDLSHPVDLKDHWARHGTNKFVTIK